MLGARGEVITKKKIVCNSLEGVRNPYTVRGGMMGQLREDCRTERQKRTATQVEEEKVKNCKM